MAAKAVPTPRLKQFSPTKLVLAPSKLVLTATKLVLTATKLVLAREKMVLARARTTVMLAGEEMGAPWVNRSIKL